MKNKLNQFIDNTIGQFIEVSDRNNIYQCMDLAFLWVFVLGFPKETIRHLYAYEVFTKPSNLTKKHFDLIPNTPEAIPEDGDLVVWNNQFGFAGHIGIALEGGTTNTFRVFEQNAPLGTNAHIGTRNYINVLGWLRPKSAIITQPIAKFTDQTLIPKELLAEDQDLEIQQIRGLLLDGKRDNLDLQNARIANDQKVLLIADLGKRLKECQTSSHNPPISAFYTWSGLLDYLRHLFVKRL